MSSAQRFHPLSLPFLLPRRSRLLLRKIIFATNSNVDDNHHHNAAVAITNTISSRRCGFRSRSSGWSSSSAAEPPAQSSGGGARGNRRDWKGSTEDLGFLTSSRNSNDFTAPYNDVFGEERQNPRKRYNADRSQVPGYAPGYESIRSNRGYNGSNRGGYKGASYSRHGKRPPKSNYKSQRSLAEAIVPEEYKGTTVPSLNELLRLERVANKTPPDSFKRLYNIYSKMYWLPPPPPSIEESKQDDKTIEAMPENVHTKRRDEHSPPFKVQEPKPRLTEGEVKKHYLFQIDPFLPPSLRKETSRPSQSLANSDDSIYPRIHLSALDVPWPSLVRAHGEEQAELTDPALQAADDEFEATLNLNQLLNMLKIIQAAASRKVDILSELLHSRRERAVFWIVRRLVDPAPDQKFFASMDIWKGSAAYESMFVSPSIPRSNNPALDVMAIPVFPPGVKELYRRRVGMGYVLRSVASILYAGFLKEQEEAVLQAKKEQERAYVSVLEARTSEEDKEFLDLLKPRSIGSEVEPLSLDEISSCAVLILAYLHSHDHVPAKVYSQKHIVLHELHHKIIRKMMEAAESSYLYDLGFKPPKVEEETGFDWACWVELVLTIATERGLSAAAGDIIMKLNATIAFAPDAACLSKRQRAEWNAYPYLKGIWHGETKPLDPVKEKKKHKIFICRSIAVQAFDGLISNGAYDGNVLENRTDRIVKYMNFISRKVSGIDGATAARALQSPFLDIRSASAIHLLDVNVQGAWTLPVLYELLLGAIARVNTEDVIRCWRRIEEFLMREGLSERKQLIGRRYNRALRPISAVADEGVFRHSPHVLSALLHYLRSHTLNTPHLIRHIIMTAITPEHLNFPAIFNPLISYAASMNEPEFLSYMLEKVPEPEHGPTLSTLINFSLRIGKPALAKVFLQRKRDLGLEMKDGFEFGLLVENAFRRSFDEGLRLMYRAIRDVYSSEGADVPSSVHRRFAFSDLVDVEREPLSRTPLAIGDVAWQSLLNAAVDHKRYDLIILALSGLGLDLSDPKVANKMGTVLFTKLLDAIVDANGSTTGMRIFQRYCIPPRATVSRSMTDKDDDRSVIGVLETTDIHRQAGKPTITPRRTGKSGPDEELRSARTLENFITKDGRPVRSSGLVVPNSITIATIVHRALKERDMVFYSRQILKQDVTERNADEEDVLKEVWKLEKQEGGMNGWGHVLTWAKRVWKEMGYSEYGWKGLDRTKGDFGGRTVQKVPRGVVMKSVELKKKKKKGEESKTTML